MKMETTVKTPIGGKILKIYVKNGDKVKSGDPLFEILA
jgi:biotin carboxyl carrier protein